MFCSCQVRSFVNFDSFQVGYTETETKFAIKVVVARRYEKYFILIELNVVLDLYVLSLTQNLFVFIINSCYGFVLIERRLTIDNDRGFLRIVSMETDNFDVGVSNFNTIQAGTIGTSPDDICSMTEIINDGADTDTPVPPL